MKHPQSRSERRHNGEVWRSRQRTIMLSGFWDYRTGKADPTKNRMWWGRKQTVGHGNRCMCHYEKHTQKRKRRVALDRAIIDNLESFTELW